RLLTAKQPVELANLLDTIALTERADMPDIVRAKLHKITGYVLRDAEQLPEALAHLQRAIQLESTIGVKKDIEQLERQLRPKPEPVPKTKTTKPRTRKPAAKPAARRGRPPKAAKAAG
ncbi:terminase, partial [Enterobacter hormaechei]